MENLARKSFICKTTHLHIAHCWPKASCQAQRYGFAASVVFPELVTVPLLYVSTYKYEMKEVRIASAGKGPGKGATPLTDIQEVF
jgi:hypothetical protein